MTRTSVKPRHRLGTILRHVAEHPGILEKEVVRWGVTQGLGAASTLHDVIRLASLRGKLRRIRSFGGYHLYLPGALSISDPVLVQECIRNAADKHATRELRVAALDELSRLVKVSPIYPEKSLIDLFGAVLQTPDFPNRGVALQLLVDVTAQVEHSVGAGVATGPLDWEEALLRIDRALRPDIYRLLEADIENAAWACDMLRILSRHRPSRAIVDKILTVALEPEHPMPAFERALPALGGVLNEGLAADKTGILRQRIRLRLMQALNDQEHESIRDRAMSLRNVLAGDLLQTSG